MKTLLALCVCIGVAAAFDCFGRNNSCAMSHTTCDTGYEPFCEHFPGPLGRRVGICTCDKECTADSDCANVGADGCPPIARPVCDMMGKVCHCFGPHRCISVSHPPRGRTGYTQSPPPHFERNDSS